MTKPLSKDLRDRLVKCVASGTSCRQAAERFGVSASAAVKLVRRWRETGGISPGRQGGDRRSLRIERHGAEILRLVAKKSDITLVEIAEHLARTHKERFAPSSVWRFLDRHAQTFKKNRARQRAGASRRRGRARELAGHPARA